MVEPPSEDFVELHVHQMTTISPRAPSSLPFFKKQRMRAGGGRSSESSKDGSKSQPSLESSCTHQAGGVSGPQRGRESSEDGCDLQPFLEISSFALRVALVLLHFFF